VSCSSVSVVQPWSLVMPPTRRCEATDGLISVVPTAYQKKDTLGRLTLVPLSVCLYLERGNMPLERYKTMMVPLHYAADVYRQARGYNYLIY
jgi:hypothetical protein